ncbi:putative nuclease HARBI1 [Haliotis asinina]|uniref:putative nuclease HARBI1 n=1 Tax=Haliotis asinina TaxID=109174 RepID=UPI0035319897
MASHRAIDGTLIPIKRPPDNEDAVYVCREGYHAVNIQAICDADMRFWNVVSMWPGSTHDSFILQNSANLIEFETNPPDGWLLGDSGCLHKSTAALWYSVKVSHNIVYVTAHLHNLCIDLRLPPSPEGDEENVDEEAQQIHGAATAAAKDGLKKGGSL